MSTNFENVAALVAATLPANKIVSTKGYTTSGDGGDGRYLVKTAAQATADGDVIDEVGSGFTASNGNVFILQDPRTNLNFGCASDGTTNDTAALQALDAAGGGIIKGGIVRVQANITLVSDYTFESGGIIAPDSIYTITWSGAITAGDYKIFDGNFTLPIVHKVDEVRITWFGALSSDADADNATPVVTDTALAEANAKAIRQAMNMCDLGIPNGIYVTPVTRIPTGFFVVDDDDNDGAIFDVKAYMTVLGEGWSSVIRPINNGKACSIVRMNEDDASNIIVDNFHIYGEASQQVNTQHGLDISPTTGPIIYSYIGRNLHIKEMNGYGIRVSGAGMDNSIIETRLVRDSVLHNLLVTACDRLAVQGGTYRTAKSGNSGAVFDGTGCVSAIIRHNNFDENNVHGLLVSNVTGRFSIYGNRASTNFTGSGYFIDRCDSSDIKSNFSEANALSGMVVDQCDNVSVDSNTLRSNGQHGLSVGATANSSIQNNNSFGNSTSADNTYDGILIASNSDDNNVQGNTVRHLGGVNQHRYGIHISGGTSQTNVVTNNDLKNSGRTASLFDDGSGTVTTAGNRV